MPTIIDSLLVTLGLDASAYKRQAAETRTDQAKVVESSDKMAKRLDADGKRMGASFRSVRNEVAGLLLTFTGAATLGVFAKGILTNDAAVGRLATNLGVATSELSKWQGAVGRVGGQSGDADSAFRTLKGIFNNRLLTGDNSANGDLAGLGIRDFNQLKDPQEALLQIAGQGENMDRSQFAARLGRLGISDSMITLLSKGRKGVADYLAEQEKLGHATEESSRAAQRFEETLAKFESLMREKIRPLITQAIDYFETWNVTTDQLSLAATGLMVIMGGLALATIAAAAPWIALAAALALVFVNFDRLKRTFKAFINEGPEGFWRELTRSDPKPTTGGPPSSAGGQNGGIIAYLKRSGFSDAQAQGIEAGITAEGGTATARNPTSGAFGIGQWLGARKKGLMDRYGPNPTHDQQMAYLVWELNGGDHGGAAVRGQSTAGGTLNAYIRKFMRPAAGAETNGDLSRGMARLGLGGRPMAARGGGGGSSTNTTSVGQITVYVPSGDPDAIAGGIRGAIAKRGLVAQSASGMNP